ncbi:MAG: MarR family transcriptional regulator [Anaerolineae bacterium]|nr:MarR family transcriptional regulator [Anaerolineae bacterium]
MGGAVVEGPAQEAVHHLLAIYRYLRRHAKRVSSELGISGRQLAVLRRLQQAGACPVGQISAHLYLAESTTSELIDGLEQLGLVRRERSPEDNRVALVTLTPRGEALVAQAPLGGIDLLRHRLRSEPPERVIALARALEYLGHLMEIADLNSR